MRAIREWLANQLPLAITVLGIIIILSLVAGIIAVQEHYRGKLEAQRQECWQEVKGAMQSLRRLVDELVLKALKEHTKYMNALCDPNDPNE